MDMDSFKSINEQRATVRHGRLIPVVSGLRPVAICIEWLTRIHIHTNRHTHGTHNEPSKRLNDSLANKYVCHWGQGEHKKRQEKPAQKCVQAKCVPSCLYPLSPVLVWLIHSPVTNSTPTRTATTRIVPIWRPPDLTFFREPPFPLPFGFGLRLTMHANDGICCPSGVEEELGLGML